MLQKIKNTLIFLFLKLLVFMVGFIPHPAALAFGSILGGKFHDWVPKERRRALASLAVAFPEKSESERAALCRRIFQAVGTNGLEFLKFMSCSTLRIIRQVESVEGREHIQNARARGRGVLCLTAHLGNWEVLPIFTTQQGWPTAVIAQRLYDGRLDAELNAFRRRHDVQVIQRGNVTKDLIRCLHKNMLLGILNDQDTDIDSRWAPFFGRPAKTPVGIFRLARKLGAAVVPVFIGRAASGRHRVYIEPELQLPCTHDEEHDLQEAARLCNEVTERFVRKFPEQWVWFHQRWKSQPSEPRQ